MACGSFEGSGLDEDELGPAAGPDQQQCLSQELEDRGKPIEPQEDEGSAEPTSAGPGQQQPWLQEPQEQMDRLRAEPTSAGLEQQRLSPQEPVSQEVGTPSRPTTAEWIAQNGGTQGAIILASLG
eukprot:1154581-Pelagomonas_calceolata.AAC.4